MLNRLSFKLVVLFTHLNILALCAVLLGAFGFQWLGGEIPCPLCVLQRVGFMLCAISLSSVLYAIRDQRLTYADLVKAHALATVCAVFGAIVAARQVLLHILPGDPGFGTPVMSVHLYTWSLITFGSQILASGIFILTLTPNESRTFDMKYGGFSRWINSLLFFIVLANLLSVFASAGLAWQLPGDPTQYLLFKSLK